MKALVNTMGTNPVIVVSCRKIAGDIEAQGVKVSYLQALHDAGAEPVILPVDSTLEVTRKVLSIANGYSFPVEKTSLLRKEDRDGQEPPLKAPT